MPEAINWLYKRTLQTHFLPPPIHLVWMEAMMVS